MNAADSRQTSALHSHSPGTSIFGNIEYNAVAIGADQQLLRMIGRHKKV
jgi:hypothetical protein